MCDLIFQLDNYEIKKGKTLKVNISVANLRLFVGNIPKSKSKDEIYDEFKKLTGKAHCDIQISKKKFFFLFEKMNYIIFLNNEIKI